MNETLNTPLTLDDLRQHELVILRRLRVGPLTEFELATEVSEHSGFSAAESADRIGEWLEDLMQQGFVWTGRLYNNTGQYIYSAALTRSGRELVE